MERLEHREVGYYSGCICVDLYSDPPFVSLEFFQYNYSQSSPCDHSGKRPAQVTTIFVKPHLSFVMKSSNKRLFPQATVITFDYSSFVFKLL